MTVPAKADTHGEIMESVIVKGDLAKLSPGERASYYMKVCESIGLNPLTRPLEYITLNNKLTLYAKRDAADQLRKINGISIAIVSQDASDGLLTVHVRAKDNGGREDEDLGVVSFPETLKGEARANAVLKCITKAKRRVTLSISGLGFLDELEVEDIPAAAKRPAKPAANVMLDAPHDAVTGEIVESDMPGAGAERERGALHTPNSGFDSRDRGHERAAGANVTGASPAAPVSEPLEAGAVPDDSEVVAARMRYEIPRLGTVKACVTWAHTNTDAMAQLPDALKQEIGGLYYDHKDALTEANLNRARA